MVEIAVWTLLVYALLVILGGVLGYLKARSQASLISGLLSGGALLADWFVARATPRIGLGLATVIAAVLLVVFTARFRRTRKLMPAGLMMGLSVAAIIVFVLGLMQI